ncbi:MAG: thymidine kinase [Fimbriimonadaceae bacterium]
MKKCGQLIVVCGSMYAGKSEELIRRARRALYAKKKVQVFKPAIDDRFDEEHVVTHMGVTHPSVPVKQTSDLAKLIEPDSDVICIEEVQFFDKSIVELLIQLSDSGKEVVVAGLDQDFRRQPFGPMAELLSAADEVIKLRAICMKCGRPASHTQRIIDGKPAKWNDPIVLIGATESYEARCRACHQINSPNTKK